MTTATSSSATSRQCDCVDQFNDLMIQMTKVKEQLDCEVEQQQDDDQNDEVRQKQRAGGAAGDDNAAAGAQKKCDRLLSEAIDFAIEQGRGWGPGEKEAYLRRIGDDDYIPPLFASNVEEVQQSGLQDAFTSLIYDEESPTSLYLRFKKKGSEAFIKGKRNQANNQQYYRDAINHYLEAFAWAEKIVALLPGDLAQADTHEPTYTQDELKEIQANLQSNIALMHCQLGNWGRVKNHAWQALELHPQSVKAWYRLAKAEQMLKNHEAAGDAIARGLSIDPSNKDLLTLKHSLDAKIRKARTLRQQQERAKASRSSTVKAMWMHCKKSNIYLGRVNLVRYVSEDAYDDDEEDVEADSRWQHHLPHSGKLPSVVGEGDCDWSWPTLFLYPSHQQSDFIEKFAEKDLLASHMAQLFPEPDDDDSDHESGGETSMVWDFDNEFRCSNLAVYVEVYHDNWSSETSLMHPESVELIEDLASCMKYCEAMRALKGDEGQAAAEVVRASERQRLSQQRKHWKHVHGSLWAKPPPVPILRIHPACTLRDVLTDARLLVPNFLVTFVVFPEHHPAHDAYVKEHPCLGVLQPSAPSDG